MINHGSKKKNRKVAYEERVRMREIKKKDKEAKERAMEYAVNTENFPMAARIMQEEEFLYALR